MPDPQTLAEYHAALNRLVTDTFGAGRQEWRVVSQRTPLRAGPWYPQRETASALGPRGAEIEDRFIPLDFCTSLDAVRQVEDTLTDLQLTDYMAMLRRTIQQGARVPLATAEERTRALLRLRNVAVPERPVAE